MHRPLALRVTSCKVSNRLHLGVVVFLLLKLLFLPIWLPLKLLGELTEHAGRRRSGAGQRLSGRGCLIVVLIVVAIAAVGGVASALGGSSGKNSSSHRPVSSKSTAAANLAAPSASSASSSTAPAPVATHTSAAATVPQPGAGPGGCHPLSDENTCYEPGEFCRTTDHGVNGLAGDGETIICENNDGWRWEPVSATGGYNPPPPAPAPSETPSASPSPADSHSPTPDPSAS